MIRRVALALFLAGAAIAEPADRNWLPPGTDIEAALAETPRRASAGGDMQFMVLLGELAFHTPTLFGPDAAQVGLACRSCHPGGDRTPRFFIPGASGHPGSFDPTTSLFAPKMEDGRDNPLRIPSLRGVRLTAPYGHDGRFWSLREFTRHVIVGEFAGREPQAVLLDALVAFQLDLDFLPNPLLGPLNRLTEAAPVPAKRGETLFARYCNECHTASAQFLDRRAHDVGTGGSVDTPSLRGLTLKRRYFHDGRTDSLDDAVEMHLKALGLGLDPMHRNELLAYLAAIGDGERPSEPVTYAAERARVERYLTLLDRALAEEDRELTGFICDAIRGELGRLHARFGEPELADWAAAMRQIGQLPPPAAVTRLAALRRQLKR
jgi:hypothetical protein